jgi:CHAT domain-containing protein
MLVTEPPDMALYGNAPYLIRERPLSMELSASLMGDTAWTARPFPLDIAALGRTRFETVPALPPALRSRLDSTGALPTLPGVERELNAVRERFARHQVAIDEQATEGRLRALQPQARILHLASHALIHPADPLANLFVLSPDPPNEGAHDGLLFLHELGARHTPVPLVVLSACGTAQGLLRTGEGLEGMQYAFRSTGARSTLSTLWEADDDIAVLLTSAFYDHLLKGLPKDVALQQAQLDVLNQRPDRASPFFWAGAVLYGTPRSLTLEPASPIPLLPVAAGGFVLLLVALGFGYSRYRRHQS